MKQQYKCCVLVLLMMALLLSGCTARENLTRKMDKVIRKTKAEVLVFYEDNKEFLSQLSNEFLETLSLSSDLDLIQYFIGPSRLDGFAADGDYRILNRTSYLELDQGIKDFEQLSSQIDIIWATSTSHYFNSLSCSFDITIWDSDIPYYHIGLVYCENGENAENMPEITEQIDDNWFLICYHYA